MSKMLDVDTISTGGIFLTLLSMPLSRLVLKSYMLLPSKLILLGLTLSVDLLLLPLGIILLLLVLIFSLFRR